MDLFDIQLESDTLIQLRHIESGLSSVGGSRLARPHSESSPRPMGRSPMRRVKTEVVQEADEEILGDVYEKRRRSASSPGPEPPGRVARLRGLTVSELE